MKFLEFFQDHRCYLCQQGEGDIPYLCPDCFERMDFSPDYIQKNGQLIYSGFAYTGALRQMITDYKFNHKTYLYKTLAHLFIYALGQDSHFKDLDGFLVIPSHPSLVEKRGFDPMDTVALEIERLFNLAYFRGHLKKIKNTPLQLGLSVKEREVNLENAFLGQEVEGKTLLLLDDILTTGATLYQASLALEDAGAKKVYGMSLAN